MRDGAEAHAGRETMAALGEISQNLDSTESNKNIQKKSIFNLTSDWSEFQKQLEVTQKRFHECFSELESRERHLNSVQESARLSYEELEATRRRFEERVREIEDKEKGLLLLEGKRAMKLALVDELRDKETKLNEKEISLNELSEKLESEKNELVALEKVVEGRLREVELIEDGISNRVDELDFRERKLKERKKVFISLRVDRERGIDMKEKEVSLIREDLQLKEKEIDILLESSDRRMKELDKREMQLELRKKDFDKNQEFLKGVQFKVKKCLEEKELLERGNGELELKKKELEDSIKGLTEIAASEKNLEAKWRELEVAEKSLKECQLKKKQCQSEKELLEHEIKVLKVERKGLEDREKQLEAKWKELVEVAQERLKECKLKEKQSRAEKELLEKANKELELKRKEFEAFEIKALEVKRKNLEDRIKGVEELVVREEQLEATRKALEEAVQERLKECEMKEKQCQFEKELLEQGNKELELKMKEFEAFEMKELELKRKDLEDRIKGSEELVVREKQLEEVVKERMKECEFKEKQCQSEKELLKKENKDLELKMKEFEDRIKAFEIREKEFEVKEKKLNDELHSIEPIKKLVDESFNGDCSSPTFTLAMELDGSNVHMFLNGLKTDLSSKDEVSKALQLSGAPAYVVLKAIEALYPPYLMKANMRFDGTVARSCILLLEQLIRCSATIQSFQREHALRLAREWKAMMSTENSLEVLGFLYLLASFDLASTFGAEEVIKLLGFATAHSQVHELCRLLGLRDKMPGVIRKLLLDNRHSLQAVGLICTFELVDQFPPVPILKAYLKRVKSFAKATAKTIKQQKDAIDLRIAAAKAVIRCIVDHKLESQYSPKGLEASIQQLLTQKVHNKWSKPIVRCKAPARREFRSGAIPCCSGSDRNLEVQDKKEVGKEDIPSTDLPNCLKEYRIDPELSNMDIGPSNPMALILARMSGKCLLSFLDLHLADHQLLQNDVSTALQISGGSAKLVLDVVEGFYSSSQVQDSMSCIFLLEQLMRISPPLEDVKEPAQRIAFEWKAKIRAESGSPLVIFTFLLFISVFRLVSALDSNELQELYKILLVHKSIPGISETTYGLVCSQIETQQIKAQDLQLEVKSATSITVPQDAVVSISSNVNMKSEQIPRFLQYSSDPAEIVLDALDLSYFSNSQSNKIAVVKSFFYLLKQLMCVSPKISPLLRGRALNLANSWKSELIRSNPCEVLAFLLLLGIYGLSPSFSFRYIFGLLEVSSQLVKEASNLFRILGLEKKVPGFILNLVRKNQCLLAVEYVYEFNLVDKIPPVDLLKKHLLHSKMVAQEMWENGQATPEKQDRAICIEISALKDVLKCILDRGLQSECSPDELRERVAQLERLRPNLSLCQNGESGQEDPRKRPASNIAYHHNEAPSQPSKKFRISANEPSGRRSSSYAQPSSQANHAAWQHGPHDGRGRTVHSGYFVNQFGWPSGHLPPVWLRGQEFFP